MSCLDLMNGLSTNDIRGHGSEFDFLIRVYSSFRQLPITEAPQLPTGAPKA
jgi:hypothetical protein